MDSPPAGPFPAGPEPNSGVYPIFRRDTLTGKLEGPLDRTVLLRDYDYYIIQVR